jgi:hypothetical protein
MLDPVTASRLTRHYPFMRGLAFLPVWIGFGLVTILNGLGWTRTASWEETTILLLSLLATVPFSRYYTRRFGVVRPLKGDGTALAWGVVAALVALILQFVAVINRFPIEPLLLLFAAIFFWMGWSDDGYRKHWLIPAVACFLLSIRGLVPLDRQVSHILFGVVYAGTISLACIWDHVLLVRTLKHVQA